MTDDWSLKGKIDDLYHQLCIKYGKAKVWDASNDEVCDLCEGYIKEIIETLHQKLIDNIESFFNKRCQSAYEQMTKYGFEDDDFSVDTNCKDKKEAFEFGVAYGSYMAYDLILRMIHDMINRCFGVEESP